MAGTVTTLTAQDLWGKWGEPAFIVLMGPPNSGKSYEIIRTATVRGWYFHIPGGLKPAPGALGFSLPISICTEVTDLETVCAWLEWYAAEKTAGRAVGAEKGGFLFAVVDDLDELLKRSWKAIRDRIGSYGRGTFDRFDALVDLVDRFKWAGRRAGLHLLCSSGVRGPNAKGQKGGPASPGPQASEGMVRLVDGCLLIVDDLLRFPWQKRFQAQSNTLHLKDRLDVFTVYNPEGPANLREYMRAAEYPYLPRLPGFEWMDDWAQAVCDAVIKATLKPNMPPVEIYNDFMARLTTDHKIPAFLAYQLCRDGIDRADLTRSMTTRYLNLTLAGSGGGGNNPPPPPPPPATNQGAGNGNTANPPPPPPK